MGIIPLPDEEEGEMKDILQAIEILRCAEINCDTAKRVGGPFVDVVKEQIQEALRLLGEDDAEEAPHA